MKKNLSPFQKALEIFVAKMGHGAVAKIARSIGGNQERQIGNIKRGESEGSEELRRKIASFFGMTYDEFIDIGEKFLLEERKQEPLAITSDISKDISPIRFPDSSITNREQWFMDKVDALLEELKVCREKIDELKKENESLRMQIAKTDSDKSENRQKGEMGNR